MKKIILHNCPVCNSVLKISQDISLEKIQFKVNINNLTKIMEKCIKEKYLEDEIIIKGFYMEFKANNCFFLQYNQELEDGVNGTVPQDGPYKAIVRRNVKKILTVQDIEKETIAESERVWTVASLFKHINTIQDMSKEDSFCSSIQEDGSAEFYSPTPKAKVKYLNKDILFAIGFLSNLYGQKIDLKFRDTKEGGFWASNIDDTTFIKIQGGKDKDAKKKTTKEKTDG